MRSGFKSFSSCGIQAKSYPEGQHGNKRQPSQQPLTSRRTTLRVPWGSTDHLQATVQVGRAGCVRGPRSSSTLLLPGCVTLGKSLQLSGPPFPPPNNGEDSISLTGLLRGSEMTTRIALHLIMVTHVICCQESQKDLRDFGSP